jgi:FkbM family methyltransferase
LCFQRGVGCVAAADAIKNNVMNPFKKIAKRILSHRVTPLTNLIHVGSVTHGYYVPENYFLDTSICYCVGAGTDISLDTELVTRYKSQVFIFDPMPYALGHFTSLTASVKAGKRFTADNDENGYVYTISAEALATVTYCATGVWNEKKSVRFYFPTKDTYAGHSITNLQNTADYIEAPVNTLSNIMRELGHQHLDLLKIEIEGAEYTVIDNVLADKIDVKVILVEFDEFHHRQGLARLAAIKRIEQSSQKLLNAGYKLAHSTSFYKRTFVRKDLFRTLAV